MARYHVRDIFKHAIDIEDAGAHFYTTLAGIVGDEQLKKMFQIMAKEEVHHLDIYRAFLEDLGEGQEGKDSGEDRGIFNETQYHDLKDKIFNRMETVKKVAQLKTLGGALNYMIDIECDVIDLFEQLQHLVKQADRVQITRIINVERSHVKHLTELRKQYGSVTF